VAARPARSVRWIAGLVIAALAGAAAADDLDVEDEGVAAERPADLAKLPEVSQVGVASWYGPRFHGRQTACGEIYDENQLTAAHPWLPFGSTIAVTNLDNGCRVVLRVTDRGPYHGGRILDCSRRGAEELGFIADGVTHVRWELLEKGPAPKRRAQRASAPAVHLPVPPPAPHALLDEVMQIPAQVPDPS
jgi:rare lipoprotein A (peptidoglycan hydrolase)